VEIVGDNSFDSAKNMEKLTFAAGSVVTELGKSAFRGCVELKSIEIPASVKNVGDYTFDGTVNLASVTFAAGSVVTELGRSAFANCYSLKSIEIPASLKIISVATFDSAVNLASVTFAAGSSIQSLGQYAFADTSIETIKLPDGLRDLGGYVFSSSFLQNIILPNSITSKGYGADYFNDTCVEDLEAVDAFFSVETKPTNLIICNCVQVANIFECRAFDTAAPTTAPTEVQDSCANLKRKKCKNNCIFSKRQRQCLPKSTSLEHDCSQYEGKTPCLEVKVCKFPHGKCVHRCDGKNARRCRKHKFCNLDKVVNPCFGCHLVTACGPRR